MAKFILIYHGGSAPQTPEDGTAVLKAWMDWFTNMGDAVIDPGCPVGMSSTIEPDGSLSAGGGANPVGGYSLIEADDLDDAHQKAKGCPILAAGGTIEIAQTHVIQMQ